MSILFRRGDNMRYVYGQTQKQTEDWQVETHYKIRNPLIKKMQEEQSVERGESQWVSRQKTVNPTKLLY